MAKIARLNQSLKAAYYAGDDGKGEYLFPLECWTKFQQYLIVADTIMRKAAINHKMEYLEDIRGSWPARRLRKRIGFKIFEIRLLLNPNYFQDNQIFYELDENIMFDCFGFLRKDLKYRKIARYPTEQMSDQELLTKDIEAAISLTERM